MVGITARQPREDELATENSRVTGASAGQPGEGETGPDSGETQALHRPEGEGKSGRDGGDGASNNRVASLGGEKEGSRGEQRVTPQGRLITSKDKTRGNGRVE